MPKKVLILGAGLCQVPFIEKVKKHGWQAIVVSPRGPYPGIDVADEFFDADIREKDKIREIAEAEKVAAVVTDQTDLPVATAAWVSEQLGLRGIGYDCALRFTNKDIMHKACNEVGIPVPKHITAADSDTFCQQAATLTFPLVVKPVDNQGSRGIRRIETPDELEDAFREAVPFSMTGDVLAEEYFEGREIVIEGLAMNHDFINLVIGDRKYFDLPGRFIPQATLFPTDLEEPLRQTILEANERLVKGFGLPFGITHSEFLANPETGEYRLLETAARGGGGLISSHLIPNGCGIDPSELLLRYAVDGEITDIRALQMKDAASGYLCFWMPEGEIVTPPNTQEVENIPGVFKTCLEDLELGAKIEPIQDKSMRKGPILIRAESREELNDLRETVHGTLKVEVQTADGVRGPVWS